MYIALLQLFILACMKAYYRHDCMCRELLSPYKYYCLLYPVEVGRWKLLSTSWKNVNAVQVTLTRKRRHHYT